MATNNIFKSDLPYLHHVVQNTQIVVPKEILIANLRDFFSKDTYYHYSKDKWGYANTVDQTDLPLGSGMNDGTALADITTRVFIGENYRYDGIFYPAILVKHGGGRSVPISINRENSTVDWEVRAYDDGYGNVSFYKNPRSFIFAGAWEGTITIDVVTRSLRSRDDLVEQVMLSFVDINWEKIKKAGVAIKPTQSWSAPMETDDRNDKLFRQTITLEIRSDWRREIPISNIIEVINFSIEFANLNSPDPIIAQNLTINDEISLLDIMAGEHPGIKA